MRPSVPLVSVLTPTYNHQDYLSDCIDSVIAQTDGRWEQIIIDDGSTDHTERVATGYDDPRIRYIRQEHVGVLHLADTYNHALRLATGEFVAVLEGDDFWPTDKIRKQLSTFSEPGVVMSWGRAKATDRTGQVKGCIPREVEIQRAVNHSPGEVLSALLTRNIIPSSTVMCRRTALEEAGGFFQPKGVPFTDNSTWLELSKVGTITAMDDFLGFYRAHDAQVTTDMEAEVFRNTSWLIDFVNALTDEEIDDLGLDRERLRLIASRRAAFAQFNLGRLSLQSGRHTDASNQFRIALESGSLSTRMFATLGLACAGTHFDLEHFIRLRKAMIRATAHIGHQDPECGSD